MMRAMLLLVVMLSMLSCAWKVEAVQVVAIFTSHSSGPQGTVTFTQASPSDNVTITVQMTGLTQGPNPWHVHMYPVQNASCASTGLHWDPFGANNTSPNYSTLCTPSTPQGCEAGDLSGKYGPMPNNTIQTYSDPFLTLFGKLSIVGRSVVIHSATNVRMACAIIFEPKRTRVAQASFNTTVFGSITLRQDYSDSSIQTTIFAQLTNADGSTTTNHKWHVHINPITPGDLTCNSAGGHYNPFGANTASPSYATNCAANKANCELGDTSGYNGQMTIPGVYFFTDPILPLSGPQSVSARSIVIHVAGGGSGRYACANLVEVTPVMVSSQFNQAGVATGAVTLTQALQTDPVYVDVGVSTADSNNPYHVHVFPVPSSGGCAPSDVAAHYDPSNANVSNPFYKTNCNAQSPTRFRDCELGDLAGKYGVLVSGATNTYVDPTLSLWNQYSVAGRSVVIHSPFTGGARLACSTLQYPGGVTTFVANFTAGSGGILLGSITVQQAVGYPSWPTSVYVQVAYPDGSSSSQHNWHVHVNQIGNDSAVVGATRCLSAGGHLNKYGANAAAPSYSTACSPSTPLVCEEGDLTGKHEQLSIPYKAFYSDVQLPITDLVNRSFVIHNAGGQSSRLACANLLQIVAQNDITPAGSSSSNAGGIAAGVVIGLLALAAIIIGAIIYRRKHQRDRHTPFSKSNSTISEPRENPIFVDAHSTTSVRTAPPKRPASKPVAASQDPPPKPPRVAPATPQKPPKPAPRNFDLSSDA